MRLLPWLFGIGVAVFFVWLTSLAVDAKQLRAIAQNLQPQWIPAAALAFACGLLLRALRWRELIAPLRSVEWLAMLRPTLVGFALNAIFPARLGELFRANYARHCLGVPGTTLLGTIIIERSVDLAIILAMFTVGYAWAPGSNLMPWPMIGLGIAVLTAAVVGIVGLVWLRRRFFTPWLNPVVITHLQRLQDGLTAALRCHLGVVGLMTLAIWSVEALSVWLLFWACGVTPSIHIVMLALSCGALSTLLPNAPGFVGALQFGMLAGVELSGGDGIVGVAVATLVQVCLYLPAMLSGALCIAYSPFSALGFNRDGPPRATSSS